MNKAILIGADEWEGLFINGKLVEEGHTLNEGYNRMNYFKKLSKQYNFDLNKIISGYVTPEYEIELEDIGSFPEDIEDITYTVL